MWPLQSEGILVSSGKSCFGLSQSILSNGKEIRLTKIPETQQSHMSKTNWLPSLLHEMN
jgi:hypothetical protein